ncbi:MAG TPA: nucleoside hydrolase [Capsulimonadaceae bacterium]|jgi:inosine-uridine nucleoside N-ribohydrolase
MRRLILDTDIDTDCDDAGTIAMLHNLAVAGECEIAGVVCSAPIRDCVGAVRSINERYGRFDIPVGWVGDADASEELWAAYQAHRARMIPLNHGTALYNRTLAATRPNDDPAPEDAVRLYRRILSGAHTESITICAIGTLTALDRLLASPPDDISPLSGLELVSAKVWELVSMGSVTYPAGTETFNWRMDMGSAANVIEQWPTTVTVSPAGSDVLTGADFVAQAPLDHPVRAAYVGFLGGAGRSRSSWDQIAALYAVRGLDGPFALSGPRSLVIDRDTGEHLWDANDGDAPVRRMVVPIVATDALAALIEKLMIGAG